MSHKHTLDSTKISTLEQNISAVLFLQCITACFVLVCVFALSAFIDVGFEGTIAKLKSSAYGAVLAIIGTLLSARSMRRTSRFNGNNSADQGHLFMVPIFSGLLNKLITVGGGIAIGLVVFGFEPILVIVSYMIVQFSSATHLLRS